MSPERQSVRLNGSLCDDTMQPSPSQAHAQPAPGLCPQGVLPGTRLWPEWQSHALPQPSMHACTHFRLCGLVSTWSVRAVAFWK